MALRFAMLCDRSGIVIECLQGGIPPGTHWLDLLDSASHRKAGQFIDTLNSQRVAGGWEMNALVGGVPVPLQFSANLTCGGSYCVMALDLPTGIEEVARNNNEMVNSHRELDRQNQALARANRELKQFAGVVSHDLRAPLRNIRQFIALFEAKAPQIADSRAAVWLNEIVANAARMQKLVDDTLAYSKLGRILAFKPVPLNEVVDLFARPTLSRDDLPIVSGDRTQLERVFQNLIENATSHRNTNVHISAQQQRDFWRITVRDNGPGIPVEDHPRLFEMFHKSGDESGSGMGLAICAQIIERLGGDIWVESEVGVGTAFYFTLRAVPAESTPARPATQSPTP